MPDPYRSLPGIIDTVYAAFRTRPMVTRPNRRVRSRTYARSTAALLARQVGFWSWGEIARALGYADHTSALHAGRAADVRARTNPTYRDFLSALQVQMRLPITHRPDAPGQV